jgi:hypothetical protein
MTQVGLADQAGVSQGQVALIGGGKRQGTVDVLRGLARVFMWIDIRPSSEDYKVGKMHVSWCELVIRHAQAQLKRDHVRCEVNL